jgi:hypothetical protein
LAFGRATGRRGWAASGLGLPNRVCEHGGSALGLAHASALGRRGVLSEVPKPLCNRTVARRFAYNTELAALPTAVNWPNLKTL